MYVQKPIKYATSWPKGESNRKRTNMRNSMWTRHCPYACAIIVLIINSQQISANDNTHYLPPLECYDPYGRPQVSKIFDDDHRTHREYCGFFFVHFILMYFSGECNRSSHLCSLAIQTNSANIFCNSILHEKYLLTCWVWILVCQTWNSFWNQF